MFLLSGKVIKVSLSSAQSQASQAHAQSLIASKSASSPPRQPQLMAYFSPRRKRFSPSNQIFSSQITIMTYFTVSLVTNSPAERTVNYRAQFVKSKRAY
jgi:hypothetical protein